jgi:hypothetical protein
MKRSDNVSNKDLGENENFKPVETNGDSSSDEIVCHYTAAAEAICLKDHSTSTVAIENQPMILEKVSAPYDCEPEKFSVSYDPGEWIIPLRDSQQCNIVHKGPIFPELSDEEYWKLQLGPNLTFWPW